MSDKSTNYLSELPADIGPFKELLQGYSHIPPEEVESHIYKIVSLSRSILCFHLTEQNEIGF